MSDVPSWLTEENLNTAGDAAKAAAPHAKTINAAANAVNSVNNPVANTSRVPPPPPPPPKSAPPRDVESARPPDPPAATASEFVIEEGVLKEMQKWHLLLRIGYCGAAIFMSASAALSLQNQGDIGLAFFAFYVFFFSALICCFEVAISSISRLIAVNFGFMYTLSGRGIFLLFVGFMVYSLSLMGKFAMGALYAVGLLHLFIMYKFPRFEEYLRKKHYFEGRAAGK